MPNTWTETQKKRWHDALERAAQRVQQRREQDELRRLDALEDEGLAFLEKRSESMAKNTVPNGYIRCHQCQSLDVHAERDPATERWTLVCDACQHCDPIPDDWPASDEGYITHMAALTEGGCVRHPAGWCALATTGYCAQYCA